MSNRERAHRGVRHIRIRFGGWAVGGATVLAVAGSLAAAPGAVAKTPVAAATTVRQLPAAVRNEVVKATASDGAAGDELGAAVAVDFNTIVVGAPQATVNGNAEQGAVYIFKTGYSGGTRTVTQIGKLTASDGAAGDGFGTSVAVSAFGVVAVGAPDATVGDNAAQGAVYEFSLNGTQLAKLTASDGQSGDELGQSVAINASSIVVAGAPNATVGANPGQGVVYQFAAPKKGTAAQDAELTASNGEAYDSLGEAVAISGSTIVAGAPDATVGTSGDFDQGAAYVFGVAPTGVSTENETAELTASDGLSEDALGSSVAISGNTIVAGAPDATVINPGQGAVYLYTEPSGGWTDATESAKLSASDSTGGDSLGTSVAVLGSFVVAGAQGATEDAGANTAQGAVYEFIKPLKGWSGSITHATELVASDGAAYDQLGSAVAISPFLYIVGGADDATVLGNAGQGAAYLFGAL